MGFITSIDVTGIDSPRDMCRALRCMAVDLFDPSDARIYLDDEDPDESPGARGTSFIIEDQTGAGDYRVTVTDAETPRPVQLGESKRKVLELATKVGLEEAIAVLDGDVPTADERCILRLIRTLDMGRDDATRRIMGYAGQAGVTAGAPDPEPAGADGPFSGPLSDDQRAILRAFRRLDLNAPEAIRRMAIPPADREREPTMAEAMAMIDEA